MRNSPYIVSRIFKSRDCFIDLMDTIALPTGFVFQMKDCVMFFGGMPPTYDTVYQRTWNSFLGQMRAITISNPGSNSLINPLYTQRFNANPYYGVVSDCNRQRIKEASFNGEAYLEVQSQPLRPKCTMGFAFQTVSKCLFHFERGQKSD